MKTFSFSQRTRTLDQTLTQESSKRMIVHHAKLLEKVVWTELVRIIVIFNINFGVKQSNNPKASDVPGNRERWYYNVILAVISTISGFVLFGITDEKHQ